MAQLKDRLITWEDATKNADELKAIIERENGRIAFYVHTGGGCLGCFENGRYVPSYGGAEKYLANVITALSEEKSVAILLGAYYEGLNEIQTQARVIDLPSFPDFPAPYAGHEIDTLRLNPFASREEIMDEMHKAWEPVHGFLKSVGVTHISPFGGEVVRFDEHGKVMGMCVNGARMMLNEELNVTVYPQLCADEYGNKHLNSDQPINTGIYTSITDS